jgi:glycogen synthase
MNSCAPFSIVVNTDGRRDALEKTLRSFRFIDYPSFEVCVVFGPTNDGTKELLENYVGRMKIGHCPERNLSMSRNIGIAMAAGDYVAFIDDDAFPEAEWLRDLERGYDGDNVGGSGGRVYDHTGRRFQYGYAVADRLGNAEWDRSGPADDFNFPLSDKFPYLQGTNASFRRSALLEIGGFDEEFEYYLDETDVCCRLLDAGYLLRQLSNGFVHHKMLPSDLRNRHRVVQNRFPVVKNKIYFSIVNNHGHHGMNVVVADACRFVARHAQNMTEHANAGRLSAEDIRQFWQDVDRAWERGLARGLSRRRRLLGAARACSWYAPFLEFPRMLPDGGRKVFCFLSKEYPPGRIGGIGTYTESAATELAKLGHHVHVLTEGDDTTDFEDEVWVHRLKVKPIAPKPALELAIPDHIWSYSGTMREELYRIARCRSITAIESPTWDVEGIALAIEGNLPNVVSLHTTLDIWLETHEFFLNDRNYMRKFGRPLLALEEYMISNSDGVHANSKAIADSVTSRDNIAVKAANLRIIHHGIRDPAALPRTTYSRESGRVYVLFVGRLERRKGIDVLLSAVATLLAGHDGMHCDIVGDDKVFWDRDRTFREVLADWPIARRCEGRVHFRGTLSSQDLYGFLARADILVVPSRFESFGLTVIEGFAFGKAVIAARTGGIAEIVDDGNTGLLTEPGDVRELAEALHRLIADRELRVRLGGAARSEYERRFSGERMARDLALFLSGFERSIIPTSDITLVGEPRIGIRLWGEETGIRLTPGDGLEIPGRGRTLYLTFWRHDWSGVVRVLSGDMILGEWDLYCDPPRFGTIKIDKAPASPIRIEPIGPRAGSSRGAEVLFYQASFASRAAHPGRGKPGSATRVRTKASRSRAFASERADAR